MHSAHNLKESFSNNPVQKLRMLNTKIVILKDSLSFFETLFFIYSEKESC
jgi:hypothetical protein